MKQYRVPQEEMTVRIAVLGGHEVDGAVFYAPARPGGAPGHLGDRLNDPEPFLPVSAPEGGRLLNKDSIVRIELGPGHLDELPGEGVAEYVPVRMTLVDGTALDGRLVYAMPPGQTRVLDYLNSCPRFVPLEHAGGITMINRNAIVEVSGDAPGSRR
jgi:hypothetical protein